MFDRSDLERKLQQGIDAVRRNDRATARRLLEEVIEADQNNELAWMWLASTVTTLSERRECLERVLEINPDNNRAREALRQLVQAPGRPAAANASPGRSPAPQAGTRRTPIRTAAGGANTSNLIGIGLVVALVVAGFAIYSISQNGANPNNNDVTAQAENTSEAQSVGAASTATPLPPATATVYSVPFSVSLVARTLPPSFTPTHTPTATGTATPTATPYPLIEFQALYTSLENGQAQPDLYQILGDGTDETRLGAAFRDVAYDPTGEQIAFIRDVAYPDDGSQPVEVTAEATNTVNSGNVFPELFVAPLSDVSAAVQVTQLRTSIVASPSWGPQGTELVFVSNYDGDEDLWYVTPDGGNLYKITSDSVINREPAWSPILGSRTILFASDADTPGLTEIYSIEFIEPGEPLTYERLTTANNSSWSPIWSQNGSMIAFVSDRDGDSDIYVMRADGRGLTAVTRNDGDAEDRRPSFTPDGRWIAFISNREDDRFQTYLASLDGEILTRITRNDRNDQSIQYRPELLLRLQ
ncbi:MAG: PD40 domain-containing protein [Chitinophagaceae bacterium]|nr:PD40 domain-containing protein [Anaerolineae bacterium]